MRSRSARIAIWLTLLAAPCAHAVPGVNLRWNRCYGDLGTQLRTFACNTNAGSEQMVASFQVPAAVVGATGCRGVIDLGTSGSTLPPWWEYVNAGSCRLASLTVDAVPTFVGSCDDWQAGLATASVVSYTIGILGPNSARLTVVSSLDPADAADLAINTEYFAFNVFISHAKSVGTGSCSGCNASSCILLRSMEVATAAGYQPPISGPANASDGDAVVWQGVSGITGAIIHLCVGVVPTRNSTWGDVKALYR